MPPHPAPMRQSRSDSRRPSQQSAHKAMRPENLSMLLAITDRKIDKLKKIQKRTMRWPEQFVREQPFLPAASKVQINLSQGYSGYGKRLTDCTQSCQPSNKAPTPDLVVSRTS